MSMYVDGDGYPSDELRDLFKNPRCGRVLLEAASEYFVASGYGDASRDGPLFKFVTGGWSGCEEVIEGLMSNMYSSRLWESSHRGGMHVFDVSGDV